MSDAIRPQDDLFGHVNGAWYDTAEIPADLPAIGGFIDLFLESEATVGEILREASEAVESGAAPRGSDRQKVGDLFASFMDEDRLETLGYEPLADDLAAIAALTDPLGLAELLGRLQRQNAGGVVDCYVHIDDRNSDRNIVNIVQGGLGLPDEAFYREEAFAEHRAKYVAHVAAMLRLVGYSVRDGRRRCRPGDGAGDPARRGPLGQGPVPGCGGDLQPHDPRRAARSRTRLRLAAVDRRPRRHRGAVRRGAGAPAQLPAGDVRGAHRGPAGGLEGLAHVPSGPHAPRPT